MTLKDITFPAFLWYVLPGINAIFFLGLLPAAVLDFEFLSKSMSWISVFGCLAAALVVGFLMDSMKLYKFTPGYARAKRAFYLQLAGAAQGHEEPAAESEANLDLGKATFRTVRSSIGDERAIFPLWEHSRWVMINHTSKLAYAGSALWFVLLARMLGRQTLFLGRYSLSTLEGAFLMGSLIAAFLMIGLRLGKESWRVLGDANRMYVDYVLTNRQAVTEKLKLVCASAWEAKARSASAGDAR